MPDKFNIAGVEFVLPSDNTKVSPSTLPVGPTSKGPDLARGRDEYNKGNYLDPDAKAYADKISGKVELVSPEFELLGALGLKGIKWLLNKPIRQIDNAAQNITKYNEKLISPDLWQYKLRRKMSTNETLLNFFPEYAKANAPIEQSAQYFKKRLQNGALKKSVNREYDRVNTKKLLKPVERTNLKTGYGSAYPKSNPSKRTTVYNKKYSSRPYNSLNKHTIITHEAGHGLLYDFVPQNPIENGFGNMKYWTNINDVDNYYIRRNFTEMIQRGTQLKNYFGLTSPDQKITPQMLEYAYKNYVKDTGIDNNMSTFFSFIDDFGKAAEWINNNCLEKGGKIK